MQPTNTTSRRQFIETSSASVAGALLTAAICPAVHAAGSDLLKVGLIGCGGRGSGAATQALRADPNVRLWAMADSFEDRLQSSLKSLERSEDLAGKLDVPPERRTYEWACGEKLFANCRQQSNCKSDISGYITGSEGHAEPHDANSPSADHFLQPDA